MKKILIIFGHSFADSFGEALAGSYRAGADAAGAETRLLQLKDLEFDPILRRADQPLEPDLVAAQAAILWSDHMVFVYPTWWTNLPALLKGFVDRVFQTGFAFRYRKDSPLPEKLLTGRTARLLITMDAPSFWNRWITGRPQTHALRRGTLKFCGVSPVDVSVFDQVRTSTLSRRETWQAECTALGRRDAGS